MHFFLIGVKLRSFFYTSYQEAEVKYIFSFLVICLSSLAFNTASAHIPCMKIEKSRVLIDQEQIMLTEKGIFIDVDNHYLPVKDLRYESKEGKYSCDFRDWLVYCFYGHPYWVWESGCHVPTCTFYGG